MRLDAQAFYLFKCMLAHSQRGHRGFPAVGYNSARAIEANRRTDSKKRGRHKQKAEDRCTERNSYRRNKMERETTPAGQRKQQIIGRVQRYQAENKDENSRKRRYAVRKLNELARLRIAIHDQ
jgi:hypothetical protein